MIDEKFSRRQLLQGALVGLAAVPAATLIARSASAAEPLSETDATAKSFGYVADAKRVVAASNPNYKPGQRCANCFQYKAGEAGAADGECAIFKDKLVKANGWCKVWMLKPGMTLG
ncbi:MAG: High potential iron-sulfur protein [Gammaproteobacteria bacterium]|nr:High potential iron-sulfur protein [Gammaproteobacteria bacterium]